MYNNEENAALFDKSRTKAYEFEAHELIAEHPLDIRSCLKPFSQRGLH